MADHPAQDPAVSFETHPSRYRHLRLSIEGAVARLVIDIQEDLGLRPGYVLKLNSYDLGVDIELADAIQRLRFEHPEVGCVVVTSGKDGVFSSGANIFMLGSSTHGWKVNFCKFTNETRLYVEDATENSGQVYIAALNGIASGGGYELPLACKEIYLVDDRRSAVALPEVPYLGVLPGTGGLTRVVDKRRVRRDRADIFCTLAEGIKGKRAQEWGLVDGVFPTTRFADAIDARARTIAGAGHPERKGVQLPRLNPVEDGTAVRYRHVTLAPGPGPRVATLTIRGPGDAPPDGADPTTLGADLWALAAFRELDDAILRLRFHHSEVGLVVLRTEGSAQRVLQWDRWLLDHQDHWFAREVLLHMRRVLKRLDMTAKSFFALVEPGSCFAGCLLDLALAGDRTYVREDGVELGLSALQFGSLPMGNGLTRLQCRHLGQPQLVAAARERVDTTFSAQEADALGLATGVFDDVDWDDEIRLATEERASLSPDALTGMEASLRWAGPETMETKIFGRLSAWQNWIFQRPNAVGPKGALTLYGQPTGAQFDFHRT